MAGKGFYDRYGTGEQTFMDRIAAGLMGAGGIDVAGNVAKMRTLNQNEQAKQAFLNSIGGMGSGVGTTAPVSSSRVTDTAQFIQVPDYNSPVGFKLELNPFYKIQQEQNIKDAAADKQLMPVLKGMVYDFKDSLDEIRTKAPEALKTGFEGYLNRVNLSLSSSKFVDTFPKTATLVDNIKADATSFAKAAGEQRPTDQDIERFLAPLLNPTARSLDTNIAKAESMVRRWELKEINVDWAKPIVQYMKDTQATNDKDYKRFQELMGKK